MRDALEFQMRRINEEERKKEGQREHRELAQCSFEFGGGKRGIAKKSSIKDGVDVKTQWLCRDIT